MYSLNKSNLRMLREEVHNFQRPASVDGGTLRGDIAKRGGVAKTIRLEPVVKSFDQSIKKWMIVCTFRTSVT
jgi:hypothetical protein